MAHGYQIAVILMQDTGGTSSVPPVALNATRFCWSRQVPRKRPRRILNSYWIELFHSDSTGGTATSIFPAARWNRIYKQTGTSRSADAETLASGAARYGTTSNKLLRFRYCAGFVPVVQFLPSDCSLITHYNLGLIVTQRRRDGA
uniref:(northern house mosquito) hypothetical protein n=1 Tax=Culex pipiens TaxID=7175 RepID=A0A8D7ZXN8_CULPI